jgi:polyisoprenoid-binding protein YceI
VSKSIKLVVTVVVALVVVVGGLGAWSILRDSAEDPASLASIGSTPPGGSSSRTTPEGDWVVKPGAGVFVGYRVHEKLRGIDKEVTGRSSGVTGTMTITGNQVTAVKLEGDLSKLTTDDPLRDGAIKRMGPETDKFPTSTFTLTAPITLPATPTPGAPVNVTATGTLSLHGVTKPVQAPLTAQWDGDQIRVVTAGAGVRIDFADYGFAALKVPVAETDAFGFFELQLLFVPA